eukprot:Rhum_TRINITY_DN3157_c0_g1::Rhum_TRINITY_DN3157_c0_g1_i1::g.9813::m.9813
MGVKQPGMLLDLVAMRESVLRREAAGCTRLEEVKMLAAAANLSHTLAREHGCYVLDLRKQLAVDTASVLYFRTAHLDDTADDVKRHLEFCSKALASNRQQTSCTPDGVCRQRGQYASEDRGRGSLLKREQQMLADLLAEQSAFETQCSAHVHRLISRRSTMRSMMRSGHF